MKMDWIIIETLAVLVENFAIVYFLNSRFLSKRNATYQKYLVWIISSMFGLVVVFSTLSTWIYNISCFVIMLIYLCKTKHGQIWLKFLFTVLSFALIIATSLLGAGVASLFSDVSVPHTLLHQDTSRLLAIILIKAMQALLFFVLAKGSSNISLLKKKSTILFSFTIIIIFFCIFTLLSGVHEFDYTKNNALTTLAAGLLVILISVFLLYDVFAVEENDNINLINRLRQLEVESHYFNEIDTLHADIRKWRHDYSNNLIALRAFVESNDNQSALEFIDNISTMAPQAIDTLQTGNLVFDAVVSSKLWLARSRGIDVSIHAVYPEEYNIDDVDLCSIMGNLLDNAIEACLRISDESQKKFIELTLFSKGKNMALSVINSFEGSLIKDGERYVTSKDSRHNGLGIRYIDSIIAKYNGHVLREQYDGVFETHILIPLVTDRS